MKKTNNLKTRIMASLLSTVTAFSVGVTAISTASAAETNSSEYILQQNDVNDPASFATVTAEDYGKEAGVDAANAAFDTLGQVFPGASILVSPFKSLFNMNVKGDDPMAAVNNKLDKMDQKLDEISKNLKSLNNNIDRNTAWLGNKTELSELKTNYRNLSAALEDFAKDVYAIESDDQSAEDDEAGDTEEGRRFQRRKALLHHHQRLYGRQQQVCIGLHVQPALQR